MNNTVFPPFITDIHTHRRDAGPDSIINIEPGETMRPGRYYSVGIHPWRVGEATGPMWQQVSLAAADPRVLAIGETGIDLTHAPVAPVDEQIMWLRRHIGLSERLGKPLILHVVKGLEPILALRRQSGARQPWVWHGFRGKPQMARQLADAGLYISLGARFNPDVVDAIPPSRLFHETD